MGPGRAWDTRRCSRGGGWPDRGNPFPPGANGVLFLRHVLGERASFGSPGSLVRGAANAPPGTLASGAFGRRGRDPRSCLEGAYGVAHDPDDGRWRGLSEGVASTRQVHWINGFNDAFQPRTALFGVRQLPEVDAAQAQNLDTGEDYA